MVAKLIRVSFHNFNIRKNAQQLCLNLRLTIVAILWRDMCIFSQFRIIQLGAAKVLPRYPVAALLESNIT